MAKSAKNINNDFDSFLNECNTYIWEWFVPEKYVKFGIPSLNGSWIDDKAKIFRLETVLEKVHPDDVSKLFTRRNSVVFYKSDKMFELDLRINATGTFEWYGFRGKVMKRDEKGNVLYLRGVAVNLNKRIKIQQKLLTRREHLLQDERQKTDYCAGVLQEVVTFMRNMAMIADSFISEAQASSDLKQREDRLMKLEDVKGQCVRILELADRVKQYIGRDLVMDDEIKTLPLWEHLAEYQQIYALKARGAAKIYFSNLYDDQKININVKLLDLLVENVINSQLHNTLNGYLTINYLFSPNGDTFELSISSNDYVATHNDPNSATSLMSESSLGLSVCRLLAQRMFGDVRIERLSERNVSYIITLPTDVLKVKGGPSPIKLFVEGETNEHSMHVGEELSSSSEKSNVRVAIGIVADTHLLLDQHLFEVSRAYTSDDLLELVREISPDIVFLDYNIKGSIEPFDLIDTIHKEMPDIPIIVTSDYAHRVLHRQIKGLGARYLLTNPLSLRKVNMMIKRYLK